jgi:hypothetical protein
MDCPYKDVYGLWGRSGEGRGVQISGVVGICCMPLINVPYIHTFGAPDHGQMLDVQESQTAKSALKDDWTRNVPHHTLEVVLEVTLEHMCTGLRL